MSVCFVSVKTNRYWFDGSLKGRVYPFAFALREEAVGV